MKSKQAILSKRFFLLLDVLLLFICIPQNVYSETYNLNVGQSVSISQTAYQGGYIDNVGLADYLDAHLSFSKNADGSATITVNYYFDYTATVKLVFIERYQSFYNGRNHTLAYTYYKDVNIKCNYQKPDPGKKPTKVILPERFRVNVYEGGARDYLTAILEPQGATSSNLRWWEDAGTAKFSVYATSGESCWIKGISPGIGRVYVLVDDDWDNLRASTILEVVDPNFLPPNSIFLPSNIEISVNGMSKLVPTLVPENTSTSYTWKSGDESIATVNAGKVVGKKTGTTTITVTTSNKLTAVCTVKVVASNGKDDEEDEGYNTEGVIAGHKYVDLGLSVKWATCNIGANNPEDSGDYFAWGETSTKSSYNWGTYKYGTGIDNVANIGSDIKGTKYDAAHENWGSEWRMPTGVEVGELISKCTFKSETRNGIHGYLITGPNGASIFLPHSGVMEYQDKIGTCKYWTSNVDTYKAKSLYISQNANNVLTPTTRFDNRCYGLPIRAVTTSSPQSLVNSISLNENSFTITVGDNRQLSATIYPSNATDKSVTWSSSNTTVATVSSNGLVAARAMGSATITCKANDGSGVSASCSVKVESATIEPTSISLPSSKTIKVGESFTMSYTLYPSNATTTLTWTSDNSQIASVSLYGVVTGVNAGTAYINVKTANGKTDYCKVTVEPVSAIEPSGGGVKEVFTGRYHSLIVKNDGSLWACGYNTYGQLGDGTTTDKYTPVKIMDSVSSVYARGSHSLIVKNDGSLWACGYNSFGQLGDGTTTNKYTPVKIMDGVFSASVGVYYSLIVKKDGSLWACGYNTYGQLGDGTTTDKYTPVKIMDSVSSVSTGANHSLIVKNDGSLWTCGYNAYGQLGDGTTTDKYSPVKIMDGVSSVSAGFDHSLIVKNDGSLWACGKNSYGQLSDGTTTNKYTPVKVMDGVSSISSGRYRTMILKKDGSLLACGYNGYGQLGDGSTTNGYTPVKIMDSVSSVSAETDHSLIVKKDGSLWACGLNKYGQLGDGTTTNRATPVMIIAGDPSYSGIQDVVIYSGEMPATGMEEGVFSISGQRLSAPQKGLNIVNGKKVIVK